MTRKAYIKSYGCQMNVYDAERMGDVLKAEGYTETDSAAGADLIILNTCHIREKAAEKVYSDIGRLRKEKEAGAAAGRDVMIAVGGCVGQAEGAEIMRRAPTVDIVFGPQTYHRLPAMLEQATLQRTSKPSARVLDTDFPEEDKFAALPRQSSHAGTAAFLTIQEGCDKFCTFCVVPYTRGAEYSRPVGAILEEARALVAGGVREITLLGQNVNAYHGDDAGTTVSLGGLIRALDRVDGLDRIRYTTSHPRDMHEELFAVHAEVASLMPYLHLPVQSGSNRILEAMNRGHDREHYFSLIERLRAAQPDLALSGDFIVGFPGETEADFEDTLDLVRRVNYAQAYSFKYSERPGTPAADRVDQVPEAVKSERLARLQAVLNESQAAFNAAQIGKKMPVLMERAGKYEGQLVGRSPYMQAVHVCFSQDIDVDGSKIPAYTEARGRLVEVEIIAAGPKSLEGRPLGLIGGDATD